MKAYEQLFVSDIDFACLRKKKLTYKISAKQLFISNHTQRKTELIYDLISEVRKESHVSRSGMVEAAGFEPASRSPLQTVLHI